MQCIVAVDTEWGIGKDNRLLFDIPLDMKFFRETTLGKVIVMGSNTLKSFPGSAPLKNRTNIVLWPNAPALREDCVIVRSLSELAAELAKYPSDDIFIAGGAMFYKTMLPYCHKALITKVHAAAHADTYFPNLDTLPAWRLDSESAPQESNGYNMTFATYINTTPEVLK
jgi:dihydrofolate reductase